MNSLLIVEDDPLVRSTLHEMLVQEWPDLSVLLAADGLEGVMLAVKKKPGLILLDGIMPVMDGYVAAQCLRQMPDTRSIPLIAITSDRSNGWISVGLRSLCNACLRKPFLVDELKQIIAELGGMTFSSAGGRG